MLIELFYTLIYGVIEGITEYLPISSTGHLLIAQQILPKKSDVFFIFIQSGAVLAVLAVFTHRVKSLTLGIRKPENFDYALKLFVCFFLTGIGGLIIKYAGFQLPESVVPVAWAVLIGGIVIWAVESRVKNKNLSSTITWKLVVIIAIGQLIAAVFPGASRSGTTIMLALIFGLSRPSATEFSFIVGIPTLIAAGGLELFNAWREGQIDKSMTLDLSVGFISAAITSFFVVRWLMHYLQTNTFMVFAWYRIGMGIILFALVLSGWFH